MNHHDDNRRVRPERTGWRDLRLSRRHREYGIDAPAVDVDLLLTEFDKGIPRALIEYKRHDAAPVYRSHPSIVAIRHLADQASIGFYIVRYWYDPWQFRVNAVNEKARAILTADRMDMSEPQFVEFLYEIRGRQAPREIIRSLRKGGAA